MSEMCAELQKSNMEIDNDLNNDTKITPFMKLFREKQKKLFIIGAVQERVITL